MSLAPGELYFIRERDVLSGETSTYCKIGRIGDSRDGDTSTRAEEHQTGNPRELLVIERVKSPAISELEASVHSRFALKRVFGEWFELSDEELAEVFRAATALAGEQAEHLEAMQAAEDLKLVESGKETRPASADDRAWFEQLLQATVAERALKKLSGRSTAAFREAADAGREIGLFAGHTVRVSTPLDEARLEEAHPGLYSQFLTKQPVLSQRFNSAVPRARADEELPGQFSGVQEQLDSALSGLEAMPDDLEPLHLVHLELLGLQASARWDKEIAEANLKASCGVTAGIEGIATWQRSTTEKEKFDKGAFKKEHPELDSAFRTQKKTRSFKVRPMRSYRPRP